MKILNLVFTLAATLLAGCAASVSDVTEIGRDSYMIGATNAGGNQSSTAMKAAAIRQASQFCKDLGKAMALKTTEATGVQWLTAMSAEITFQCVAPESATPVTLRKTPDTVIEVNQRP